MLVEVAFSLATSARGRLLKASPNMSLLELEAAFDTKRL